MCIVIHAFWGRTIYIWSPAVLPQKLYILPFRTIKQNINNSNKCRMPPDLWGSSSLRTVKLAACIISQQTLETLQELICRSIQNRTWDATNKLIGQQVLTRYGGVCTAGGQLDVGQDLLPDWFQWTESEGRKWTWRLEWLTKTWIILLGTFCPMRSQDGAALHSPVMKPSSDTDVCICTYIYLSRLNLLCFYFSLLVWCIFKEAEAIERHFNLHFRFI